MVGKKARGKIKKVVATKRNAYSNSYVKLKVWKCELQDVGGGRGQGGEGMLT